MTYALLAWGVVEPGRFASAETAVAHAMRDQPHLSVHRTGERTLIVDRLSSKIYYEVVEAPPNPPLLSAKRALPL